MTDELSNDYLFIIFASLIVIFALGSAITITPSQTSSVVRNRQRIRSNPETDSNGFFIDPDYNNSK